MSDGLSRQPNKAVSFLIGKGEGIYHVLLPPGPSVVYLRHESSWRPRLYRMYQLLLVAVSSSRLVAHHPCANGPLIFSSVV